MGKLVNKVIGMLHILRNENEPRDIWYDTVSDHGENRILGKYPIFTFHVLYVLSKQIQLH